ATAPPASPPAASPVPDAAARSAPRPRRSPGPGCCQPAPCGVALSPARDALLRACGASARARSADRPRRAAPARGCPSCAREPAGGLPVWWRVPGDLRGTVAGARTQRNYALDGGRVPLTRVIGALHLRAPLIPHPCPTCTT